MMRLLKRERVIALLPGAIEADNGERRWLVVEREELWRREDSE